MKKTILNSIAILIAFNLLLGCGGGSKEAKELLSRLLFLVGIPQSIVVNICQDEDNNGFCEKMELQVKVTINRGDSVDTIWEKLTENSDGTYFLDNYDPKNNILLELQDSDSVRHNDGKFTLVYNSDTNGISQDHNNTPKKELSILQSMVDAGHLNLSDTTEIKKIDAVEQFYSVLLNSLMENLNILADKGMTPVDAMSGNIKEMADELLVNGIKKELPDRINGCHGDQICIDGVLNSLADELKISDEEAQIIKENQEKEEDTPPVSSSGDEYDMWSYLIPSTSRTITSKEFQTEIQNGKEVLVESEDFYSEDFKVISSTEAIAEDGSSKTTYTVEGNKIVVDEYDEDAEPQHYVITFTKNAKMGDTILTNPSSSEDGISIRNHKCVLSNYFNEITIYKTKFNNLLEITCSADITYGSLKKKEVTKTYVQEGNGVKAEVDRSCVVDSYNIDDSSSSCREESFLYVLYE